MEWAILGALPVLGLLMVSRMPYTHLVNRYFDARRAQPVMVVLLVLLVYLVIDHFVETVTGFFLVYAISGPLLTLSAHWFGWPAWVEHEEGDEETFEQAEAASEERAPGNG